MTHYEKQSMKELRAGMGEGLVEAGRKNENVVALSADVKGSVKMDGFAKEFPERFVQCGIAEANMVGIAAGLSLCGKVPFIGGFAEFVTGRVYDQIRQVLCYSNKNVKICGSHAGISLGEDGATHQTMEDIALMKVLPNMTVLVPAETRPRPPRWPPPSTSVPSICASAAARCPASYRKMRSSRSARPSC